MTETTSLALLAAVLNAMGDLRAAAYAAERLAACEHTGNTWGQAPALFVLGRIALRRGDRATARRLHVASLAFERDIAHDPSLAGAYLALAELVGDSDASRAQRLFHDGLAMAEQAGDRLTLARGLEGLPRRLVCRWPERAIRLAAAAEGVRSPVGARGQSAARHHLSIWLDAARSRLGRERFAAAWALGCALTSAQAVIKARGVTESAFDSSCKRAVVGISHRAAGHPPRRVPHRRRPDPNVIRLDSARHANSAAGHSSIPQEATRLRWADTVADANSGAADARHRATHGPFGSKVGKSILHVERH